MTSAPHSQQRPAASDASAQEASLPDKWSVPQPLTSWAKVFDVNRKTIAKWIKQGNGIRAKRVGSQWSLNIKDIPVPHQKRFESGNL